MKGYFKPGVTSKRTRTRLMDQLRAMGIENEEVLQVMMHVPRHLFVEEALNLRAYENVALPIGRGQTISQPYIVARMTDLLMQQRGMNRVLEIGTGSGYQTAVLAELVGEVYSVERIESLHLKAKRLLIEQLDYPNVELSYQDGNDGWQEYSPYSGIIVTAAAKAVPQALLDQLSTDRGRLVIPVGEDAQHLQVITRNGNQFTHQVIEPVVFVPFLNGKESK